MARYETTLSPDWLKSEALVKHCRRQYRLWMKKQKTNRKEQRPYSK
jgi:hypothetical protein